MLMVNIKRPCDGVRKCNFILFNKNCKIYYGVKCFSYEKLVYKQILAYF